MAKATLKIEWTDPEGVKHEEGEEIDLPRETDEDKITFDHLLASGIIKRGGNDSPPAAASEKTPKSS